MYLGLNSRAKGQNTSFLEFDRKLSCKTLRMDQKSTWLIRRNLAKTIMVTVQILDDMVVALIPHMLYVTIM